MGKLIKMRVLLSGLRGLGAEIAKNLILAGPAKVTLHDPEIIQISDLNSNFFLQEEHVGKISRAEATVNQFKDLNPSVDVSVLNGALTTSHLENFDLVVITENFNRK